MPFTWNQVNNLDDPATTNSYRVYYPSFPGVDGNLLALFTGHLTLPAETIGHIQVRLFDYSFGFRGGLSTENQIEISFFENVNGDVNRAIDNWMSLARSVDGTSELKNRYSGNGKVEIYDTTGKKFITVPLTGMFPFNKTNPELNDTQTAAYELTVSFNVDLSDIDYGSV